MFISIIMFYFTNVSAYVQEPDSLEEETFPEELLEEPYEEEAEQYERAKVLEFENTDGAGLDEGFYTEILSVRIILLSGERKGEESDAIHYLTGNPDHDFSVTPQDRVLVNIQ